MLHLNYRICSLADLKRTVGSYNPTHVVSLLDPDMDFPRTPKNLRGRHTCLSLHDVDCIDDGTRRGNPHKNHVATLLAFAADLTESDRVLFHCVAGKRRSASAALICDLAYASRTHSGITQGHLDASLATLIARRAIARPNLALLSLADDPLRANGLLSTFRMPPRVMTLD